MQNLVVVSHTVRAHVGGPKFFGKLGPAPLWTGIRDVHDCPLRDTLLVCYQGKFGHSRSNLSSVIMEICQKTHLTPRLSRSLHYSRSLKPTRIDRQPMNSCYCSIVILKLYLVPVPRWNAKFSHPFPNLRGGSPCNFVTRVGLKKLECCPYQIVENVTIYSFNHNSGIGRTDGLVTCMLTRVKMYNVELLTVFRQLCSFIKIHIIPFMLF